MSGELRVFTLAPNQPGKGGTTEGLSSFLGIEGTRTVLELRPFRKQWKKDRKVTLLSEQSGGSSAKLTGFVLWRYYAAGNYVASEIPVQSQWSVYGTAAIVVATTGLPLLAWDNWPFDVAPPIASICPVKDRLVMATGNGYPKIWDGTFTTGVPDKVWNLGCPSPTIAPTITLVYNYSAGDYWYGFSNSRYACTPVLTTQQSWDGLLPGEGLQLTHSSLTSPAYVERKVVLRESGTTTSAAASSGPFAFTNDPLGCSCEYDGVAGDYFITVNKSIAADLDGHVRNLIGLGLKVGGGGYTYLISDAVNTNNGKTEITFVKTNPADPLPSNVLLPTASFSIFGVRVTMDGDTPGLSVAWQTASAKLSRPLPGSGYTSWSGAEAPGFAYAYYDPVSGHMSNMSPATYVDTADVVNGRIEIDIAQNSLADCANGDAPTSGIQTATGIQYIGEYSSLEVLRFTHIIWFRTRLKGGGAVFYPLGSLDPASGNWLGMQGSPAYAVGTWVDGSTDAALIVSGRISAPQETNFQPRIVDHKGNISRIVPAGMAWWDGRLWIFGPPDSGALHYSCDDAQSGLGRPEESFPDTNRLAIPAGDGEITSILVAGEYLLVNTQQLSYIVQGNNESNYRLVRIAAELGGVYRNSICEVPTGANAQATVAAITRDRRVLLLPLGGEAQSIGAPITPWLGNGDGCIAFYRADEHPRLVLAPGMTGYGCVLEFNFDHGIWTCNPPTPVGATRFDNVEYVGTVQNNGVLGFPSGVWRSAFPVFGVEGDAWADCVVGVEYGVGGGALTTWTLPVDQIKRRHSFAWARIVLSGVDSSVTVPPQVRVWTNERSSKTWTFNTAPHADIARRSYPDGYSGGSLDGSCEEYVCFGAAGYVGGVQTGELPCGFRLHFSIDLGTDVVRYSIAFVEIVLREETVEGGLEP